MLHQSEFNKCFIKYNHVEDATTNLFCFPFAASSASLFRTWVDLFPNNIQVYLVQLSGRESRSNESFCYDASETIEHLTQAIIPGLNRPYAFYGHSMGALLAYEVARKLRNQNFPQPLLLAISGRKAPHLSSPEANFRIKDLNDVEFQELLNKYGGTPEVIMANSELMQFFLPRIRADFMVLESHKYIKEEPLDCKLLAFASTNDHLVSQADVQAWEQHTTGPFICPLLEGDHFFIQQQKTQIIELLSNIISNREMSYVGIT